MKRLMIIALLTLGASVQAAPWTEAIKSTKHPVARQYLIASYWSWREYKRWSSHTNLQWALAELDVAIKTLERWDNRSPALQLAKQIKEEIAR